MPVIPNCCTTTPDATSLAAQSKNLLEPSVGGLPRRVLFKKQRVLAITVLGVVVVLVGLATVFALAQRSKRQIIIHDLDKVETLLMHCTDEELSSFVRGTDERRLAVWKAAAEKGMPEAQCLHALALVYGAHCRAAPEEAFNWYRKAADQGLVVAQFEVGNFYDNGGVVAEDAAEALKWWHKAADQGFTPAVNNIGTYYRSGKGVPQDDSQAVQWYRQAAEKGDVRAQWNLGGCYALGHGLSKDMSEAARWYRKAAEQGYP